MDDLELLRAYVDDGDLAALSELVHKHRGSVLATCWRKLGSYSDAEDATQEVFLALMEQAPQVRVNVGAWLHQCAVNIANSTLRTRRRSVRRDQEKARLDAVAAAPGDAILQERIAILDQYLGSLDSSDHQLLVQNCLQGSTQQEIASELGVSQQTVSKRLSRIVGGLRWGLRQRGVVAPVAVMLALAVRRVACAGVPQRVLSLVTGAPGGGGEPVVKIAASLKVAAATFILVSAMAIEEDQSNRRPASPASPSVAAVLPEERAEAMGGLETVAPAVAPSAAVASAGLESGSPVIPRRPAVIVRFDTPEGGGLGQVVSEPARRAEPPAMGIRRYAGPGSMAAAPLPTSANPIVSKDWPLDLGSSPRITVARVPGEARMPAKSVVATAEQSVGARPPAGDGAPEGSMPNRFVSGGGELPDGGEMTQAMRLLTMAGAGEAGLVVADDGERRSARPGAGSGRVRRDGEDVPAVLASSKATAPSSPGVRDQVIPTHQAGTGQAVASVVTSEALMSSDMPADAGSQALPRLWPYSSAAQASPMLDPGMRGPDDGGSLAPVNRVVPLSSRVAAAPEPSGALLLAPACVLLLRRAKRSARGLDKSR